jgi:UDP-N-acetylmuramate--alanine ligase
VSRLFVVKNAVFAYYKSMSQPHLYLIGIGGVGMVWIADYALSQGWQVSGTDLTDSPQIQRLQQAGAHIHLGADPAQIPSDITEVIITAAITESSPHYPELQEIHRRNILVQKRAQWIGALTKQKYTIAVCGSHGKTSTTAMIGWILDQAGMDPTVFVGSNMPVWQDTTRIGHREYLVLEADEFDRSFHQFYPQVAVVLNIDQDHTDYFTGGLPEIAQAFRRFLRNLPSGVHAQPHGKGLVVAYGRDKRIRVAAKGFQYRFRWYDEAHLWPGIHLPQPGNMYMLNATAAARVAHELGVSQEVITKALNTFPGVGRRFESLGTWHHAELYDDYAHHPTEIAATLQAIRERWPVGTKKVTVVFQPHQKARTQALLKEFGRCFDMHAPDTLILAPIYQVAGREEDIPVSNHSIAEIIQQKPVSFDVVVAEAETLPHLVEQAAQESDVLIIMGAGSIRSMTDSWRKHE